MAAGRWHKGCDSAFIYTATTPVGCILRWGRNAAIPGGNASKDAGVPGGALSHDRALVGIAKSCSLSPVHLFWCSADEAVRGETKPIVKGTDHLERQGALAV